MAKLYTRRGDSGETGLLGPERVSKDDPRVEAMGTVDELNAVIGLAMAIQRERRIRDLLSKIQDDLFTVGAELAISHSSERTKVPQITRVQVARLEDAIDAFDVGKITEFILPRGSESLARLHWARTVARRAERRVVSLSKRDALNPQLLQYMNRLSSLLYQMAVWAQRKQRGKPEHPTYNEQAGTKG
ncbi:MAG: cob(I)yrinic acid a,c-diamide adenosyltransferase [Methanobacteriota archaeon]|nr:MAG: cob(I)yrinic acid a,c-diamide adenosyltransferase [Euryarchaeota archaeon]